MILSCFGTLVKWVIIIGISIFIIRYWLDNKTYVFNHENVARIATKFAGQDPALAFDSIANELRRTYPSYILPPEDTEWALVSAGAYTGNICVLYSSITEYIFFFGTPIDTTGHSGRNWVNISISVLTGTYELSKEGSLTSTVHKQGESFIMHWGEAAAVHLHAGTWIVEYGRGFVPSTVAYSFSNSLFVNQDFSAIFHVSRMCVKSLVRQLGVHAFELREWLKSLL